MFKAMSLLLVLAAITGCQSLTRPGDFDSPIVGVRCMVLAGKKPFERGNLLYIKSYANYGNPKCKAMLGKMYQEGGYGVDQDFSKARALFVEAAQLNPSSNVLLGGMAERGEGEPADYAKARAFYRLSGKNAALPLGRLMEEGKGGPQDLAGALAVYLEAVEYFGDDAWKAMSRLHKQGQALDEVQAQRYQQIWMTGFVRLQQSRLAVREVFEAVNATGATWKVTLSYRFKADSGVPQVTMIERSGDANVDDWIMKAASRITMQDSGPLTDESGEREIRAPLVFSPQDTRYMFGLCGRKPCS
ncbi:tetratricopeptide repeat protein [Pseudomonas sp. Marseille-P9899]|uniref:tetratricopeptide repeat protein n=1 Tax=Pseudomonas sp. Marseille-P9899 TaxID=2730401 RepID=UPI00158A0CB6|nr:SEL1-like repeat protein [Pseudomonas sp. Marseille-P9899]